MSIAINVPVSTTLRHSHLSTFEFLDQRDRACDRANKTSEVRVPTRSEVSALDGVV